MKLTDHSKGGQKTVPIMRVRLIDRPIVHIGFTVLTVGFLCGLVFWGFNLLKSIPAAPTQTQALPPPGANSAVVDIRPVIVPTLSPTQVPIRFPANTSIPTPSIAVDQAEPPPVVQPLGGVTAFHRDGQTFLTWSERLDLSGERYRIYRSVQPVTVKDLNRSALLLSELSAGSANFYANRYQDSEQWSHRYSERLIIDPGGDPLPSGTGLFVWTVSSDDLGGDLGGEAYYAVTLLLPNGEEYFSPADMVGPIPETIADASPVEITRSPQVEVGEGGHVYIQYMDFRSWNPTFHAPNPSNNYLGFKPKDPTLAGALAYAYDYVIFEPTSALCGGSIPNSLPVLVFLHGWRGNRYTVLSSNFYPFCGYAVYPYDESETWYFGFARDHDYRQGGGIDAGDVIENYTEQRILRMIDDLIRQPPGPAADPERVYVAGHSMGGSGALAFAERFPNVFAAAYSAEPITDYLTAGITHEDWAADAAVKWGDPGLNLPVHISAPSGWADHLQKYNGISVWYWQNYAVQLTPGQLTGRLADEMAPFGIDHGIPDHVILWNSQGMPVYHSLNTSRLVWGGIVTWNDHEFSDFLGLPPSLGKIGDHAPFWNFQVIRDETVPGLSSLSTNPSTPTETTVSFNQTVKWSASWDPWDGKPLDQPDIWRMSFCSVAVGSFTCGSGADQTVDVTPRRLQTFTVIPGAWYDWENRRVSDNSLVASGSVKAGDDGLLTIPSFLVTPIGNRLMITPR